MNLLPLENPHFLGLVESTDCLSESISRLFFILNKCYFKILSGLGNLPTKNRLMDRFIFLSSKSRQVSLESGQSFFRRVFQTGRHKRVKRQVTESLTGF